METTGAGARGRSHEHRRALSALLRQNFDAFAEKAFATLAPGQTFVPAWYLQAIGWRLEQVRCGELRRLIINLPPRSLKSVLASVAFPAFVLGHDPSQRVICVSYSGDLAKKHANDFRAVMEASWYRALFPAARIGRKDSETEIEMTARGFRLATSVGGTLTGRGAQIIVIDDPLKPEDALSEPKRTAANQWFNSTLMSRLDDKRTGAIVIVMQRLHVDDLTGFVRSLADDWTVLSLPAIATVDEEIPLSATEAHLRRISDVLAPGREPLWVLEELRQQLGSDAFSAQYQQTRRRDDQARLGAPLRRGAATPRAAVGPAELGHRQQGRSGERLLGLHHLDPFPRPSILPYRRLPRAAGLSGAEGRCDPAGQDP
jgi:hypothetical protein